MAINPGPLILSLEIPGREGRIDNTNAGEKFKFEQKQSEDPKVSVQLNS